MADAEQYQDQAPDTGDLRFIPIDRIDPAEDNPRRPGGGPVAGGVPGVGVRSRCLPPRRGRA